MKEFLLATAFVALMPVMAVADPPVRSNFVIMQGSHLCLQTDHIQGRTITDDRTIVFRMDDGTYWKNTLQESCPGLRIADSFAFTAQDKYICSNQQRIRVLGQGTICFMGDFVQTVSPIKSESKQ